MSYVSPYDKSGPELDSNSSSTSGTTPGMRISTSFPPTKKKKKPHLSNGPIGKKGVGKMKRCKTQQRKTSEKQCVSSFSSSLGCRHFADFLQSLLISYFLLFFFLSFSVGGGNGHVFALFRPFSGGLSSQEVFERRRYLSFG